MIIFQDTDFQLPAISGMHFADGAVYRIAEDSHGHISLLDAPSDTVALDFEFATLCPEREFAAKDDAHLLGGGKWSLRRRRISGAHSRAHAGSVVDSLF